MTKTSEKEKERIRKAARLLCDAAHHIRILRSLDWPASVKQGSCASGARELPLASYAGFDATPAIDILREARWMIIPISPIDLWLERQANSIEAGARMLAGVGTPAPWPRRTGYTHDGVARIEALILSKVIMIGNVLRLGRGLEDKPLIFPTIYKALVFTVFAVSSRSSSM
jgi:hypothetical protein